MAKLISGVGDYYKIMKAEMAFIIFKQDANARRCLIGTYHG